jgi:hypothetical protein
MASRASRNTTTGGVQMAAPTDNVSSQTQQDIYVNTVAVNSGLQALVGKTIRGLVVGTIEKWADGGVYDTGNNRFLYAGSDFDPAILNRG